MFNIGMPELAVVFIVALIVMGPKRLPEIARQLGKAVSQFKRSAMDLQSALEQEPPEDIKQEVRDKFGYREVSGKDNASP